MTLTILSVAFPFAVVGPGGVGGAEQVLASLESALVARGNRSIVVAREGSEPAGRLLATHVPAGVIDDQLRERVTEAHQANIDFALASNAIDLIHMHGIDFHRYTVPAEMPVLVTLHLPPSWYPEEIWSLPPNYQLVCVSETQRRACPLAAQERLWVVGNGVPIPLAETLPSRRDYAVMLSRICPEKNLHAGFDAARIAGVPVLLAGETFPYEEHLRYMREQVEPRLGDRARLLDPVSGAKKTRLLAKARCLLLPTLAPETSSLVAMEAIAVGTPVVAYRSGAIPEIVEHGRTGLLVDTVEEMAEAIARCGEIDPAVCRSVAAELFPVERMVQGYVNRYAEMAGDGGFARVGVPGTGHTDATSDALRASVLTSEEELEALAPEWRSLWRADSRATPFQSPEWLVPWWKHVGEGELFVVTVRNAAADLVGLLPMYIYAQPEGGERQLLLLGAGTSDYLDGLFAGSSEIETRRVVEIAMQHLRGSESRWDRGVFHQLRSDSPLLVWAHEHEGEVFSAETCSVVRVEGWAQLPAKIRANSRRYRRRAEAVGDLRWSVATSAEEALQRFEVLLAMHAKRWTGRGESSVLSPSAIQSQHRESISKLQGAGLLRMFSLQLADEIVAVLYALVDAPDRGGAAPHERRMYCYLIGFNPEFAENSPGTLLLSFAYDTCAAESIGKLDMLRGAEGYKELWGAAAEPTFGFLLGGASEPIHGPHGT